MSTTPTTKARPTGAAKKTAAAKADPTPDAKGKLLAEARTEAIGQLLDENRERFNELMEAAAKKRNVTWKRRPTEAEKREAKLKALLEEDPRGAARRRVRRRGRHLLIHHHGCRSLLGERHPTPRLHERKERHGCRTRRRWRCHLGRPAPGAPGAQGLGAH